MKEHYELLYVIAAKQAVADLEPVYKKVRDILTEYEAVVTHEEEFRRARLAYPIKHTHQGIYILIEFDGEKESITKIEQELKHTPEVLRQMIVKRRILSEKEIERVGIYKAQMAKEHEARKRHWEDQQRKEEGRASGRDARQYEKHEDRKVLVQQPMEHIAATDRHDDRVSVTQKATEEVVKEVPVSSRGEEQQTSFKPKIQDQKVQKKAREEIKKEPKDDTKKKVKQEKVALEDLDKKLDEILDDTLFS